MSSSQRTRNYNVFDPAQSTDDDARKRGYLARNILPLIKVGLAEVTSKKNELVVEVGPGKGLLQSMLKERGFASHAIEVCEAYADDLKKKGYPCELASNAADALRKSATKGVGAIVAVDVLEHLPLEEGMFLLSAAADVLPRGGSLILQVPNVSGLFGISTFAADPTHLMPYNEHSLRKVLEAAGFVSIELHPMKLPGSATDALRSVCREVVFFLVRCLQRVVGATPCRILTHNIVARAVKA